MNIKKQLYYNNKILINLFNLVELMELLQYLDIETQKVNIGYLVNKDKIDLLLILLYKANNSFTQKLQYIQMIHNTDIKALYHMDIIKNL